LSIEYSGRGTRFASFQHGSDFEFAGTNASQAKHGSAPDTHSLFSCLIFMTDQHTTKEKPFELTLQRLDPIQELEPAHGRSGSRYNALPLVVLNGLCASREGFSKGRGYKN